MAGVLTGLIVTVVVSYIKPDNFDWEITRGINAIGGSGTATPAVIEGESPIDSGPGSTHGASTPVDEKEKGDDINITHQQPLQASPKQDEKQIAHDNLPTVIDEYKEEKEDQIYLEDPKKLRRAFILAVIMSGVLSFIMDFLIPIPMFISQYVFSK
jgi:hypothetical protein